MGQRGIKETESEQSAAAGRNDDGDGNEDKAAPGNTTRGGRGDITAEK
jgi:hypothetical protein